MPDGVYKTEELSLWECLHDGEIKQVRSDLMARTLTVVVNSSFHWGFHNLPEETRFELVGENVRVAEVFSFEAWEGARNPPQDAPWEEAEKQRKEDSEKGRLISIDWKRFTSQIETDEDCLILSASLETSSAKNVLSLGVMSSQIQIGGTSEFTQNASDFSSGRENCQYKRSKNLVRSIGKTGPVNPEPKNRQQNQLTENPNWSKATRCPTNQQKCGPAASANH
jgi:hypothetical protein